MMKHWLVGLLVVVAGCQRSEPPPAPVVQEKPTWEARGNAMLAKLRVGMSQDEVVQALGEPTRHNLVMQGGVGTTIWQYDLTERVYVQVQFGPDQRLQSYRVTSPSGPL
jgi:hypothetical protein